MTKDKEKRMTPKIRFKRFSGDWEQRKLGDFVIKAVDNRGKTPPTQEFGRYPLLEVASLGKASPDYTKVTKYVDEETYNGWFRAHIKKDDILFSTVGNTGLVTLMDDYAGATIAQNIVAFRAIEGNNPQFLVQMFQLPENLKRAKRIEMGAVQPSIKVSQLIQVSYLLPNSEQEQEKIGLFFKQVDTTITLHQQKYDQLIQLKKAYLDLMFPKTGESTPQVRFADFHDNWEQRKLREIVQITMGQSPNSENYTENPFDHILVQGNADMKNNRVVPRVWTTQITKQAEKGDLILSVRAPVGDIGKTDYDVVLGRGVAAIKGNDFIFQQLGKMKEEGFWNRFSTGSTFESINSNDIKEALITIPNEEEQKRIGNFFARLDQAITLHQKKIASLKFLKQAYLQKMFV
ncbi:restriction endonuclease subunit S [Enterococcus asini]|uniref:restriction endonuclease subunit S n=1 Tax=Enterococcus asini TaxID=57732 RepID=UPI0026DBC1A6|nr:restriction endonuclease subunit S [Enterococcus asini]